MILPRANRAAAVAAAAVVALACCKHAPDPEKSPEQDRAPATEGAPAPTAPTEGAAAPTAPSAAEPKPVQESPVSPQKTCIEEWTVARADSVLQNQRRVGPHSNDFQEEFEAHEVDPARYLPVEVLEGYRIEGAPLTWFTPDRTRAVVDARHFSALAVADPLRGDRGSATNIGRLLAVGKIGGRQLLKFLVAAGVIRTYWHLEATLCLEQEDEDAEGYRATVSGVHTYYTNEKNQDRFAFDLRLAADGSMTVIAR